MHVVSRGIAAIHPKALWDVGPHAAFIKDHTLTAAQQTSTSAERRGPTCIKVGAQKRPKVKKKGPGVSGDAVKLNAISRDFMNRARCQIHNFKQIDFQLLLRRTTSRCATDGGRGDRRCPGPRFVLFPSKTAGQLCVF